MDIKNSPQLAGSSTAWAIGEVLQAEEASQKRLGQFLKEASKEIESARLRARQIEERACSRVIALADNRPFRVERRTLELTTATQKEFSSKNKSQFTAEQVREAVKDLADRLIGYEP